MTVLSVGVKMASTPSATAACAATGEITVDNDGCVAKSYPRFWEDFSSLKGEGL